MEAVEDIFSKALAVSNEIEPWKSFEASGVTSSVGSLRPVVQIVLGLSNDGTDANNDSAECCSANWLNLWEILVAVSFSRALKDDGVGGGVDGPDKSPGDLWPWKNEHMQFVFILIKTLLLPQFTRILRKPKDYLRLREEFSFPE